MGGVNSTGEPEGQSAPPVVPEPLMVPVTSEHDWHFVENTEVGFHVWQCDRCGAETWTNIGASESDPPDINSLNNSGTFADCDFSAAAVIQTGRAFNHTPSHRAIVDAEI